MAMTTLSLICIPVKMKTSCMARKFGWKITSLYTSEDEDQLHVKEVPLEDY